MNNNDKEKIKQLVDNMFNIIRVEENYVKLKNILKNNSKGNKVIIGLMESVKSIDKRMDTLFIIEVWQREYKDIILTEEEISEKLFKDIIGKDNRIDSSFEVILKKRAYVGFIASVTRLISNTTIQLGGNR